MQDNWQEIEIKNFRGISTRRTPDINECADCVNIELRDKDGDMLSIANASTLKADDGITVITVPDFSLQGFTLTANLGFTTHVFSQLSRVTKEVIFYFQRGTVGGYPHIAIGMYPFYNKATGLWLNGWRWLNRTVITTINTAQGNFYGFTVPAPSILPNYYKVVYNITKQQWAPIYAENGGYFWLLAIGWAVNDTIIVMDNYMPLGSLAPPFPYFTAQSLIETKDLVFHRVLNDLRIGWGSIVNRLGVGVGHRKKYFQIDSTGAGGNTGLAPLDEVILDPYNIISDDGTYTFVASEGWIGLYGTGGPSFPDNFGDVWIRMTVILDDFNEFLVAEKTFQFSSGPLYPTSRKILVEPWIRFATMNKRITKIRFWIASGLGTIQRMEDYRLVREFDIAKSVPLAATEKLWSFSTNGYLVLTTRPGIIENNRFEINYSDYLGETETQAMRMSTALGYTPTLQYASSWDQAIINGGSTYLLNPYIDKTWKNFIFNSPVSGTGAMQYDVISAENYQNLDRRDGVDIVGIEVNANLDFTILRNNGYQQYDPVNQISSQMFNGIGCTSRLGIINSNGAIFFPSQFDFYAVQGNQNQNLTESTIKDEYRALTKTNILGGRENYGNAIRFYAPTEQRTYIFSNKGWIKHDYTILVRPGDPIELYEITGYIFIVGNEPFTEVALQTSSGVFVLDLTQEMEDYLQAKQGVYFRILYSSIYAGTYGQTVVVEKINGFSIRYIGNSFNGHLLYMTSEGSLYKIDPLTTVHESETTIIWQSVPIDISLLGEQITSDERFVIGSVWMKYSSIRPLTLKMSYDGGAYTDGRIFPISSSIITKEARFAPGKNAKSLQLKLTGTLKAGDARARIAAIGLRWKTFKTGLFR